MSIVKDVLAVIAIGPPRAELDVELLVTWDLLPVFVWAVPEEEAEEVAEETVLVDV